MPQLPQLDGSVCVGEQPPEHTTRPMPHKGPGVDAHSPGEEHAALQVESQEPLPHVIVSQGVDTHVCPHCPQACESVDRSRHAPPQSVKGNGHDETHAEPSQT